MMYYRILLTCVACSLWLRACVSMRVTVCTYKSEQQPRGRFNVKKLYYDLLKSLTISAIISFLKLLIYISSLSTVLKKKIYK